MGGRAENPFSALVELLRKQAEAAAPPAWVWGEVVSADPLSVMVGGVKLRPDQIAGAESLQGAAAGKRVPLIGDATGQHYAVLGEQRAEYPPEEHKHTVSDLTDFPASMPASDVSAWAKAETKPTYTNTEVGAAAASHAHGNITSDGKVGSTADLPLMTGADGLVVAKTMAEAISIWKFTNPNLLHNWDFRNPVNQRGVTTETLSAYKDTIDRWGIGADATYTVNSAGYITLSANSIKQQILESGLLKGKTVTLTILNSAGTFFAVTGTFPTVEYSETDYPISGFGNIGLQNWGGRLVVRLKPTVSVNVSCVKLELGNVSTLAYDPPMDYGVELAKCQRYYQVLANIDKVNLVTATDVVTVYNFAPMRIAPSVLHPSLLDCLSCSNVGTATPSSVTISYVSNKTLILAYTGTFTNWHYGANSNMLLPLSADL